MDPRPAGHPRRRTGGVPAGLARGVTSIVADYRASADIDIEHDRADRAAGKRLVKPVTVVQQDCVAALGFDAAALWRTWADDLEHRTTSGRTLHGRGSTRGDHQGAAFAA
ncbi:hypothetical protein O7621_17145 [Solwaraspora sp. WMMD937]|uniref:hypothetical protein n=1 Tax=Solwaraspora sp. WMMD937 TaxID=3016090 RepID=UPI00249CB315|nr:hypothetical protein [Solwaraspora sp. WMMD937]WFE19652.1 hypothetical protein O7621_17145 [Solwaraspora sp. WMMD937]